jgi:putative spermidine/putrescine transport system permease protein
MKTSTGSRFLRNTILTLIFIFILLPVGMVVYMSLISNSLITFPPKGYSFSWYSKILDQPDFFNAFILSFEVAFVATIFSLIIGLLTSLALSKYEFKGKGFLQNIYLSPLVVPAIITGIAIYIFLFNAQKWLGLRIVPSMASLIIAHIVITIPWTVRLIHAGLEGTSQSLEEAAINLGASRFKAYWHVIIPTIRPSLIAAGIFAFIFSFNNLEISLMLVSPGQTTLPIAIYNYVFWKLDPLIAAVSTVQIVIIAILMIIADRIVGLSKVF